jgi:hypothetical protein
MLQPLEERKLTSLLRNLSASQRAVYEGRHDIALENAIHVINAPIAGEIAAFANM